MTDRPDPARRHLVQLLFGFYPLRVMHTLVTLAVPEHLVKAPAGTVDDLAEATGTHAPSLRRLLRASAGLGLVRHGADGTVSLTDLGRLLHPDTAGSVRNLTLLWGGEEGSRAWGRLADSIRTGEIAYEQVVGQSLFDHLAENPEQQLVFNHAMAESSRVAAGGILAVCPLGEYREILDVGGGSGSLLAVLLGAHPQLRGVLFDRPGGVADAQDVLDEAGVLDRGTVVCGDFFESVPTGADCYLMKSVLHDWDDDRCVRILVNCAAAMGPQTPLYIIEPVVPVEDTDLMAEQVMLVSDLNMLVCTGGVERSQPEFEQLLARAGLVLDRVTRCPAPSNLSVIRVVRSG
ncbi:MAG: methyltransferase [Pseudonocardiaceae bacterium]